MKIITVPFAQNNYAYILCEGTRAIVIDPGEAGAVEAEIEDTGLILEKILLTHHHADHSGGADVLAKKWGIPVYGSGKSPISAVTHTLHEDDTVTLNTCVIRVLELPGHTQSSLGFFIENPAVVFTGDTLFSAVCGKVFDGTLQQMYTSLQQLAALPETTHVYFGHEYTQRGLDFAESIEPDNREIHRYRNNLPARTTPTTMVQEKMINPFLRTQSEEIRRNLSMETASALEVFTALRKGKDRW
ncbi:MAG: hydroxyacylglutathione hydrolase [Fibrobacterota bacterium]